MPNIREFGAPAGIGLNPTETGIDAIASSARHIGAFYNAAAQAQTDTGRSIASGVQDVGNQVVQYEDHREISAGAAAAAQLQLNLNKQWNDVAKNADPNNPSVAAKFHEEVVAPALEKFQSGFSTDNSQKFAEQKVEQLRTEMFHKTTADMSTMAGIAVRQNLATTATSMSNTAMLDPSSVPGLLDNLDHSVAAVVSSSPTMNAVDAARAGSEVTNQMRAAIVKAGAIGAIQKAGDPEAEADKWIKQYPDIISGEEAKGLAGNARQQIRARNYDFEMVRRRSKEVATDASNEATGQYLVAIRSQDPRLQNDPTAQKVLNDPSLLKTDKANLLNLIDRQMKPETDARISQQTFVGLLRDMRSPDADPETVMQKAWDARLTDPGKPGSMTEKDFNQLRAEVVARKTPEGAALERDRGMFFKQYAGALGGDPANPYDPLLGSPKLYRAEMDARRMESDLKRRGLDPHLVYDPSSEYFIGNPKRLMKYQGTMQDDLGTRAAAPAKSTNLTADGSVITGIQREETPIVPAPPQRTAGNLYDTPKGKLKWTGTGWVKP